MQSRFARQPIEPPPPFALMRWPGDVPESFDTLDALATRILGLMRGGGLHLSDWTFWFSDCDRPRRAVRVLQLDEDDMPGAVLGYAFLISRPGLGSYGERATLSQALRKVRPALVSQEVHHLAATAH